MATLNDRTDYTDGNNSQLNKKDSVAGSKLLVTKIIKELEDYLESCLEYEPDDPKLRINNAPAVELPSHELVIAPDIKCKTKAGEIFWIEAKDKCQRFYPPDTGADLHQVLGWYKINKYLSEPVFLVFQDASLEDCSEEKAKPYEKNQFKKRWDLFKGNMYGAWLSELLIVSDSPKYPKIFFESTRSTPIYILYFYVKQMSTINNWEEIIGNVPESINDLQVFRKCVQDKKNKLHEVHTENELAQLMINNLQLIKFPTSNKYTKNTPFVELEKTDLKKALTIGLKRMREAHKNEELELDFFIDELCRRKNKNLDY